MTTTATLCALSILLISAQSLEFRETTLRLPPSSSLGDQQDVLSLEILDYDSDGSHEVLLASSKSPTLLLDPSSSNPVITTPFQLPPDCGGLTSLGDLDLDGHPDVLAPCDATTSRLCSCSHTSHRGWFCAVVVADVGSRDSAARQVDVDADGRADLVVAHDGSVWTNTGREVGRFQRRSAGGLPRWTRMAQGDYDEDGLVDLLLCEGEGGVWGLWRNDGGRGWTKERGFPEGVGCDGGGPAAFADVDLDGDLDVVVAAGAEGFRVIFSLVNGAAWRVEGGEAPSNVTSSYKCEWPFVAVGDVNNDGWPDLFVTCDCRVPRILLNTRGGGGFIETPLSVDGKPPSRIRTRGMDARWEDFDRAGLLDLLWAAHECDEGVANNAAEEKRRVVKLWTLKKGPGQRTNVPPTAPLPSSVVVEGDRSSCDIVFCWEGSRDDANVVSLTYNLQVWSVPPSGLEANTLTAMSDLTSGVRKVSARGNGGAKKGTREKCGERSFWTAIRGVKCDRSFRWRVQAVDSQLSGGPFSEESFAVSCGDGFAFGTEECDGGDGCVSSKCLCDVSRHFVPTKPVSRSCTRCGNGLFEKETEDCDATNVLDDTHYGTPGRSLLRRNDSACDSATCRCKRPRWIPTGLGLCIACGNGVVDSDLLEECDGGLGCDRLSCRCSIGYVATPKGCAVLRETDLCTHVDWVASLVDVIFLLRVSPCVPSNHQEVILQLGSFHSVGPVAPTVELVSQISTLAGGVQVTPSASDDTTLATTATAELELTATRLHGEKLSVPSRHPVRVTAKASVHARNSTSRSFTLRLDISLTNWPQIPHNSSSAAGGAVLLDLNLRVPGHHVLGRSGSSYAISSPVPPQMREFSLSFGNRSGVASVNADTQQPSDALSVSVRITLLEDPRSSSERETSLFLEFVSQATVQRPSLMDRNSPHGRSSPTLLLSLVPVVCLGVLAVYFVFLRPPHKKRDRARLD